MNLLAAIEDRNISPTSVFMDALAHGGILRHDANILEQVVNREDLLSICHQYPHIASFKDIYGNIALHYECSGKCRLEVILKLVDLYSASVSCLGSDGTPLHRILRNDHDNAETETAIFYMIKACKNALAVKDQEGNLPIHIELFDKQRAAIVLAFFQHDPSSLDESDSDDYPLLYQLLKLAKASSMYSVNDLSRLISKNPAVLTRRARNGNLPIHYDLEGELMEMLIRKTMEYYPELLGKVDSDGNLPLHRALFQRWDDGDEDLIIQMMETYPAALSVGDKNDFLPLHILSLHIGRPRAISRSIELFPEALKIRTYEHHLPFHQLAYQCIHVLIVYRHVEFKMLTKIYKRLPLMSIMLARYPPALVEMFTEHVPFISPGIIQEHSFFYRLLLNLDSKSLPSSLHSDYCRMNWQARAAFIKTCIQVKSRKRRIAGKSKSKQCKSSCLVLEKLIAVSSYGSSDDEGFYQLETDDLAGTFLPFIARYL
jgi:ankyrin repeat protein